jgi:conserved oligomeric Golgi complex subunit 7
MYDVRRNISRYNHRSRGCGADPDNGDRHLARAIMNRSQGLIIRPNPTIFVMLPASTTDVIQSLDSCEDTVGWINQTLNPHSQDLSGLDKQVTKLLATVDIACEETSTQLERIIDDVARAVPRLNYDLHFVKDVAFNLQNALNTVQAHSDASPFKETALTLERLKFLDMAKGNMEAAKEVLREVEAWSTLESEVTMLLAERSYAKAAERLSEAGKSMAIFENTPDYESRRTLMVSLQNQLEASLSSALVAAITSQDVNICREYFSIFSNIQRESEFRNYYNGSRRAPLVAMWQSASLVEGYSNSIDSTETPQPFVEFLPKFYANFLSLLEAERIRIPSIFPDPYFTLSTLMVSVLSALQPTFSQRLATLLNYHGAYGLKEVISVFKITEEFATQVEKLMEKSRLAYPHPSFQPPRTEGQQGYKSSKKHFSRISTSWRTGQHRSSISGWSALTNSREVDWNQDLFQPFLDVQTDYGLLERRLLETALNEIVSSGDPSEVSDRVRLVMKEKSVDVCRVAEEAMARCITFTHGYAAIGLVQALDNFFRAFMDMWTADIVVQRSSSKAVQREDVSGLDYSEQDWADFQLCIHLLAAARAVYERMVSFEAKLRSNLAKVATTFRMAHNDPSNFASLETASGELLAQSTLNSSELQDFFSSLDSEVTQQSSQPGTPALILIESRVAVFLFAQACQIWLQDIILCPLQRHLAVYASLGVWSTAGEPKSRRQEPNDLQIPSFSLSPTDAIQQLAEGMLNLPRLFEVYADDDALSFSLQTLPHIDAELVKRLTEQPEPQPQPQTHVRRSSMVVKPSVLSPEAVSAAWLSSLGGSILAHFTLSVLPSFKILTSSGTAQLAADLGYFSNVVHALNLENEELERWKELLEMDDDEGRKKAAAQDNSDKVFSQVARLRGWRP